MKKKTATTPATDKPYTCIVCGKHFSDLWVHLRGKESWDESCNGMMVIADQAHRDYWMKEFNKGYDYDKKTCFCGGKIWTYGTVDSDGDASWSTNCLVCDFLYDED